MELKNLQTFKTIVEAGSFTAAAETLNYTQSTITFQIDQLETELSVKLFEKIGRKMVLTAAGKALIPYADEVIAAVGKLDYFEKQMNECSGALRIGVAETYLNHKLPAKLKQFVEQAPNAKLYIQSMNCYEIRNELINGSLDIGIFYREVGGFADSLVVHPLGAFPVTLVASPTIAQRFADFKTPQNRLPIPLIINEPNCIFRQIFEQYLKHHEIILDHTIELSSIATIKQLVENNVGVSFLPCFTVEQELAQGRLVEIETNIQKNEINLVFGYHKNKWLSPLLKLFMECVGV